MPTEKEKRGTLKCSLTKGAKKIRKLIIERDKELLVKEVANIKKVFKEFDICSEGYHLGLTDAGEKDASETYMQEVEGNYLEVLKEANAFLDTLLVKKEKDVQPPGLLSPEVLGVINLPKMELFVYNGEPLLYYPFITAFDEVVHCVKTSDTAKLSRLIAYTSGTVKSALQPCLILGGSEGYSTARAIMKDRFGDDFVISQAIISLLRDGGPVRNASDLRKLSDELVSSVMVLKRLRGIGEVESQRFITSIVDRLQPYQKGKWKKIAFSTKRQHRSYPNFDALVDFVKSEADDAMDPVYGESGLLKFGYRAGYNTGFKQQPPRSSPSQSQGQEQSRVRASTFATSQGRADSVCDFCQGPHVIYLCGGFRSLKPEQRLAHIREKGLCENCLRSNHSVDICYRPSKCGIGGCTLKHSRFIHACRAGDGSAGEPDAPTLSSSNARTTVFAQSTSQVCVPIVSVRVNNKVVGSSLLDTCSTASFISSKLAKELDLKGVPVTFELSTLSSNCVSTETVVIPSLYVESCSSGGSFILRNVFVTESIPECKSNVDTSKFDHLRELDVLCTECSVDLLIGQDNAEALIPLEVRRGKVGEPFAVRTVLGWSLHGNTGCHSDLCGLVKAGKVSHRVVTHFIQSDSVISARLDRLEDRVEKLWELDQEGLAGVECAMSGEDEQVIRLWDENVIVVDGHYELPIPWKEDVVVPDNLSYARSRLESSRHGLVNRDMLDRYECEVQKLLDKGYAEPVVGTESEIQNSSSKVWYLPHQAVVSPKKPGKLRVVFDCAARYKGESLNDKCYQDFE